jgi:hypothetical protein
MTANPLPSGGSEQQRLSPSASNAIRVVIESEGLGHTNSNCGKRDEPQTAQTATLALAYKWLRIIHRCWKDRVPYDEAKYLDRLKATGSPLVKLIT